MENRKEIAARLGIKLGTLHTKLWARGFKPTEVRPVGANSVEYFDAAAVAEIEAMFKKKERKNVE